MFSKKSFGFKTERIGKYCDFSLDYDFKLNEKISFFQILSKSVKELYHLQLKIEGDFQIDNLSSSPSIQKRNSILKKLDANKPTISIYAGSSQNAVFRRWPLTNYLEVVCLLNNKFNVCFIGGADEKDIQEELISVDNIVDLIGFFSLSELSWFLKERTDVFLGNDGGLSHLADLHNLNMVSIFGPSLGSKWGPLNKNATIIESDMTCRPCLRNDKGQIPQACPLKHYNCMNQIKPVNVIKEIKKIIREKNVKK